MSAVSDAAPAGAAAAAAAESLDALRARYAAAGQAHLFLGDNDERLAPALAAGEVDLARVAATHATCAAAAATGAAVDPASLAPLPELLVPSRESDETRARWYAAGIDAYRRGEVGVVCMAGGQASRLGLKISKGMFDMRLPSGKVLYQLFAEKLRALQRTIVEHGGDASAAVVPFYVMTSPEVYDETREFFARHAHFGLRADQVHVFAQQTQPCTTPDGKLLLKSPSEIARAPDGHGGMFAALRLSGAIDDMRRRRLRHLFTFTVDNPLLVMGDPAYVGLCLEKQVKMGYKVVNRRHPKEPAGVVCVKNGVIDYVEYSEIPDEIGVLRQRDGDERSDLLFNAANILNLYFSVDFAAHIAADDSLMPYHIAKKKIAFWDAEARAQRTPDAVNGWKYEKFILDCTPHARNSVAVVMVEREREFSPIKNGWDKLDDSPHSARALLAADHRRRLLDAGAAAVEGVVVPLPPPSSLVADATLAPIVEISPLLTDRQLAALAKGKTFTAPCVVDNERASDE